MVIFVFTLIAGSGFAQGPDSLFAYKTFEEMRNGDHKLVPGVIKYDGSSLDSVLRYRIITPKKQRKANLVFFYKKNDNYYINSLAYSSVHSHFVRADTMMKNFALLIDVDPERELGIMTTSGILGGAIGGAIAHGAVNKFSPSVYVLIINQGLHYIVSAPIMKAICRNSESLYEEWEQDPSLKNTKRILGILDNL